MNATQIIAIVLVRNEELFVEQVVRNIFSFCDRILLIDHDSCDETLSILQRLQQEHPEKISVHQIQHPSQSHELLKPWVGKAAWVFAVDGDELYDPERLPALRQRLLAGEFDSDWMLLGNVLHVATLDTESAAGYFAPPSRSVTKLYNFAAIESWEGKTVERLHGGAPLFRPGFHEQKKRKLFEEESWEQASLRCLHLCFIPRSRVIAATMRQNIMETYTGNCLSLLKNKIMRWLRMPTSSSWKQNHYARGECQRVGIAPFFKKQIL